MLDKNGNEVLVGCELRSEIYSNHTRYPDNTVTCIAVDDEGTHLVQDFKGAIPFIMPENSEWIVYKSPLKEDYDAKNREED